MDTEKLHAILDELHAAFPDLQRVGIYANARDINRKSEEDLRSFAQKKMSIFYIGLESGSDKVLRRCKKGATARQQIDAVKKAQGAGLKASVIGLLGLGGRELSHEHAIETARAASEMNPRFLSFLTLMIVPGTPLAGEHERGEFEELTPLEGLQELKTIVENLDVKNTIFRTNHASNFLPIAGTLPKDKERIIQQIDSCLSGDHPLRPEWLRGL